MSNPILKEGYTEFEIIINPNLKFVRVEPLTKGVKRYWGYDNIDNSLKIMYVQYPKSNFSRDDIKRIMPKYTNCKLCTIGRKFIKGKNNNTNMNVSIIDLMGKIPLVGNSITRNRFMTEPVIMQTLSTLTRYPLSIWNTELGKRLLSLLIGVGGLASVKYFVKNNTVQSEWANFFANYISSSTEMNAQKGTLSLGIKDDVGKLKRAIKSRNFYGIADSLVRDPTAIKRAVQNITGQFSNVFRSGRLRVTENTMPTKKLFGGSEQQFAVNQAGDFKYTDTSKRFRDISNFGSGFRKERRFRESGDAAYIL